MIRNILKFSLKWIVIPLCIFGLASAVLYALVTPKQDRDWVPEHAVLPIINISGDISNPEITVKNIRDFRWQNKQKAHYTEEKFVLKNIVAIKAAVSHFSIISEIAHVFMIFVLEDGREIGVSIEARREKGETFSLHGGLLAKFELIYVIATPEDLLGIRKLNQESVHIYPIKASKEKAQELFLLIAKDVNKLHETPRMYHLFFKNCTNQLVKNVSILTDQQYPWYFQTLAPGNTAKILYRFKMIDLPDTGFKDIQKKTFVK